MLGSKNESNRNVIISPFAWMPPAGCFPIPAVAAPVVAGKRYTVVSNMGAGRFKIADAKGQIGKVAVWDGAGRFVCRQKGAGGIAILDITGEPAGVYLLQVSGGDGVLAWERMVLE